jgi:hypothetical protein
MKNKLSGAFAAIGLLCAASPASAVVWTTAIEWGDPDSGGPLGATRAGSPFGTVTVTEVDAFNVRVQLDLASPYQMVDTGSHEAFTFNLLDAVNSTVTILSPNTGDKPVVYEGAGAYTNSPFGDFTNAFKCCGPGSNNPVVTPFTFNVFNAGGISFAGANYALDANGKLTGLGSGNRFASNDGGWWFAVDTLGSSAPASYTRVLGGRDAFASVLTAVPEPATWAMMLIGFGSIGALLRRSRRQARAALA